MRYVYIQNGQVVDGPRMLPISWENVSNFNLLDNETLKSYGWYPHRFIEARVDETIVITGSSFVIEENEVLEYQTTRPKTESEIQADRNQKWMNIRSQRAIYLSESDWTVLPDSPLSGSIKQDEWKAYRQALRDITKFDNPDYVIWPEKPSFEDVIDSQSQEISQSDSVSQPQENLQSGEING